MNIGLKFTLPFNNEEGVTIEFLVELLAIIILNIVLSGDNAVVIALATRKLVRAQRRKAIVIGTIGAVILRITLMLIAMQLLTIPFVKVLGSVLLFYIAYDLVKPDNDMAAKSVKSGQTFVSAVGTIVMADLIMSLDNVLAIAGAANGSVLLAIIGLVISIPIVVFASQIIVTLMDRFPVLVWIGALLIAYTAGSMIIEDKLVAHWLDSYITGVTQTPLIPGLFCVLLILVDLITNLNYAYLFLNLNENAATPSFYL